MTLQHARLPLDAAIRKRIRRSESSRAISRLDVCARQEQTQRLHPISLCFRRRALEHRLQLRRAGQAAPALSQALLFQPQMEMLMRGGCRLDAAGDVDVMEAAHTTLSHKAV